MLVKRQLHSKQFAYQAGKSTETALHCLINDIEKAMSEKDISLCMFMDIEGAFDNTSFISMHQAMIDRGIDASTAGWVQSVFYGRKVVAEMQGSKVAAMAAKGCPQGGVLSPLLWSLVVDSLLEGLSRSGFRVQAYADDLVIEVRGRDQGTLCDLLQQATIMVRAWCMREGLSVNPHKTSVVPFTKRVKLDGLRPIVMDGVTINLSSEVKYLGVTLDKRLNWNPHLRRVLEKAKLSYWTCRRLLGTTWGLSPNLTRWMYTTVIRPMITYAALVCDQRWK